MAGAFVLEITKLYEEREQELEARRLQASLSPQRGPRLSAKAFFKKATRHEGHAPHTITLDGSAASHRAVREMQNADMLPKSTKLRSSKYLNNLVEQDHRGIKSRTRPMLGFKNFNSAAITLARV
jgi:transposase-like protein